MSKQFIVNRHTTPSTPTLDEVPNEKIRTFKSETALDAALSSLDEDEIVATEDGAESSTRIGNPLGTILALHSNAVPYGYLPCNGVAFDENQYPALYALLGDNHTPYRYDKTRLSEYEQISISTDSTNPTEMQYDGLITIHNMVGTAAFKIYVNGVEITNEGASSNAPRGKSFIVKRGDLVYTSEAQYGNTYFVARFYKHPCCIKATSGLEETQQDYVLQSLLEADNYSTDEVATGKKWIDGKMIYRKCFYSATNWSSSLIGSVGAVDTVIRVYCTSQYTNGHWFTNYDTSDVNSAEVAQDGSVYVNRGGGFSNNSKALVVVEYTKA